MPWLLLVVSLLISSMVAAAPVMRDPVNPYLAEGAFVALSYHEARDDVRDYPDPYAVDSAALVRQFSWLRGNGYTPVSLDQIITARRGGTPLPPKAVLLSFDDSYLSFYTRVYPLLREFHFPAVLGVVGKWIDAPRNASLVFGEKDTITEASFPTWKQLREMSASGLVEIASHTYDLHRGVPGNVQGNLQPAATTRIYDTATGIYENEASWRTRVRDDLARNSNVIERETGHRPRAIVWPYGSYSDELVAIAGSLGMSIGMTLDDGSNTPDVPLTAMRRTLVEHNPALPEFIIEVRGPLHPQPIRVVQINLDDVYNIDPMQQEKNLSALLEYITVLKPTHVYLQATADLNNDGIADATYFPNRHLPLRADLFNRTAWQLASRVDTKVFAVMPVNGFRISPSSVIEVYEDLARYANFDGLVFQNKLAEKDMDVGNALQFTQQLAMRARAYHAPLKTVRVMNVGPAVAIQNTQKFTAFANAYDYVALTVAPTRENAAYTETWVTPLIVGMQLPSGNTDLRHKTIFMFSTNEPSSTDAANLFVPQMRALQRAGLLNFGYVANDFLHDNPPLVQIAPAMSLRVYPQVTRKKAQ